jgi:hypothetical protein
VHRGELDRGGEGGRKDGQSSPFLILGRRHVPEDLLYSGQCGGRHHPDVLIHEARVAFATVSATDLGGAVGR